MVLGEFSAPGGVTESSLTEGVGLAAREVDCGGRQEGRCDSARRVRRKREFAGGNLATLLRTRVEEGRLESRGRRGGGRSRACEGSRGCSRAPGRQ